MFKAFDAIYRATCTLLPAQLDAPEAKAMLIAIALQESRFEYRRQVGGPARGWWQFELGGVRGVLTHKASKISIGGVLDALCYGRDPMDSHVAIEHNDVLACAYARLLLWTLPESLPKKTEPDEGWDQYMAAWRPGKPHRSVWDANFTQAWSLYA